MYTLKPSIWKNPLVVSAVVGMIYLILLFYLFASHQAGPSILHNQPKLAYDGKYFYAIAVEPLSAFTYLGTPAFRYQRIMYPLLARVLGIGHPEAIDWTLLSLSLGSVIIGTWLLGKLLISWGVNAWYSAVYGLFIGQFVAVRFDTSEPLVYLFVLLAVTMYERNRYRSMTIFFALAFLTKELAILFWLGYMANFIYERKWKLFAFLGMAAIPYAVWQIILFIWLGNFGFAAGGASLSAFPFGGFLNREFEPSMALFPLILLLPALISLGLGVYQILRYGITAMAVALILNALLIVFMPQESTGEIRAIGRMSLGLVLALLLFAGEMNYKRVLNYSLFWIPTSAIYLVSLFR